jgi:DNA-binding IscR family transcriptional regulator
MLTVGEVLRFVEGRPSERTNQSNAEGPFANLWHRVDRAVSDILDSATFAQLARDWDEQTRRFVPNWEI